MYGIKVELKLNNREKTKMNQNLGFARFCYNYALSLYNQLEPEKYSGGSSKKIDLIKKTFTNVTKKNPDFAWTKTLSSRVYQNAFRNLKTAFSRFFQGLGKYPKYKKKKHPGSFTVDSSNGVILQEGGPKIKLPTLGTFRTRESIPKCVAQTYTISKRGNKYYVAFAINAELIPPIVHEVFEPVGLDVNLSDGKYCVLSDGTEITYPKPLKAARGGGLIDSRFCASNLTTVVSSPLPAKLSKLQYRNRNKELGNRKKGIPPSNNARKYYQKLAKLQKQIADKRNDFLQKLTTDLSRKYRHIRVETLKIQGLMQNKKLAFHFADASFYKFKRLLQNKALTHGGIIESVDMFFPSSKLCSQCGNKKTDLKLKERIYHCSNPQCKPLCRDYNSSLNLAFNSSEYIVDRVGSVRAEFTPVDSLPPTELTEAGSKPFEN